MKLRIVSVHEQGSAKDEYVLLEASDDCSLSSYMVCDTTYSSGGKTISNRLRHTFWFPTTTVKKGDRIILQTTKGTNSSSKDAAGKTTYRFFWKLNSAVWNDSGDVALLVQLKALKATKAVGS